MRKRACRIFGKRVCGFSEGGHAFLIFVSAKRRHGNPRFSEVPSRTSGKRFCASPLVLRGYM